MKKFLFIFPLLIASLVLWAQPILAEDASSEIQELKSEIQRLQQQEQQLKKDMEKLLNRIEDLEKKQAETEKKAIETEEKIVEVEEKTEKVGRVEEFVVSEDTLIAKILLNEVGRQTKCEPQFSSASALTRQRERRARERPHHAADDHVHSYIRHSLLR